MNAKEKASKIANKFVTKSVFDMNNEQLKEEQINAKRNALICIDEIIDSLEITTGHFELNKMAQQEVQKDFSFWNQVKKEVEKL